MQHKGHRTCVRADSSQRHPWSPHKRPTSARMRRTPPNKALQLTAPGAPLPGTAAERRSVGRMDPDQGDQSSSEVHSQESIQWRRAGVAASAFGRRCLKWAGGRAFGVGSERGETLRCACRRRRLRNRGARAASPSGAGALLEVSRRAVARATAEETPAAALVEVGPISSAPRSALQVGEGAGGGLWLLVARSLACRWPSPSVGVVARTPLSLGLWARVGAWTPSAPSSPPRRSALALAELSPARSLEVRDVARRPTRRCSWRPRGATLPGERS
jgi:hypothetical protein